MNFAVVGSILAAAAGTFASSFAEATEIIYDPSHQPSGDALCSFYLTTTTHFGIVADCSVEDIWVMETKCIDCARTLSKLHPNKKRSSGVGGSNKKSATVYVLAENIQDAFPLGTHTWSDFKRADVQAMNFFHGAGKLELFSAFYMHMASELGLVLSDPIMLAVEERFASHDRSVDIAMSLELLRAALTEKDSIAKESRALENNNRKIHSTRQLRGLERN